MGPLPVALWCPGPIRFPPGLAHYRSPRSLCDTRRESREASLSPFIAPTATIDEYTGSFSDSLLEVQEWGDVVRAYLGAVSHHGRETLSGVWRCNFSLYSAQCLTCNRKNSP